MSLFDKIVQACQLLRHLPLETDHDDQLGVELGVWTAPDDD